MFSGIGGDSSKWDYVGHAALLWAILAMALQKPCFAAASGMHPQHPGLDSLFLLCLVLPTLVLSLIATIRAMFCGGGGVMLAEGILSGLLGLWVGLSFVATISFNQGNVW